MFFKMEAKERFRKCSSKPAWACPKSEGSQGGSQHCPKELTQLFYKSVLSTKVAISHMSHYAPEIWLVWQRNWILNFHLTLIDLSLNSPMWPLLPYWTGRQRIWRSSLAALEGPRDPTIRELWAVLTLIWKDRKLFTSSRCLKKKIICGYNSHNWVTVWRGFLNISKSEKPLSYFCKQRDACSSFLPGPQPRSGTSLI